MLIKILIGLATLLLVLVVVITLQPNDFKVSRSATIAAPPAVVFAQVNDLHKWQTWSPWAKLDPNAKETFEGPPAGVGAALGWAGNHNIGEGRMTITESRANEYIRFKLEFFKPFAGTNTAEFTFAPEGTGTVVTWTMFGKMNFVSKAMSLVMNCDKMMGGYFEQGLAQLKAIAEGEAKS